MEKDYTNVNMVSFVDTCDGKRLYIESKMRSESGALIESTDQILSKSVQAIGTKVYEEQGVFIVNISVHGGQLDFSFYTKEDFDRFSGDIRLCLSGYSGGEIGHVDLPPFIKHGKKEQDA